MLDLFASLRVSNRVPNPGITFFVISPKSPPAKRNGLLVVSSAFADEMTDRFSYAVRATEDGFSPLMYAVTKAGAAIPSWTNANGCLTSLFKAAIVPPSTISARTLMVYQI